MEFDKLTLISILVFACFLISMCDSNHNHTDGVYERAVKKIDNGQQLNQAEAERISDIINWEESKKKYNIK